ncbi:MAG: amidohydrolase/deacetylase family metallohydrolase [Acidimicrobiia bacterium]|nr:amidohydrolase/deacetylase family metallohydrolase [Acidimicrobiia bacterium]
MSFRRLRLWWFLVFLSIPARAQQYDLLIKGGRVIDPSNRISAVVDVAVTGGKIAQVAASIPASQARTVADAAGMYVVPGLIDIHAHVYYGTDPDASLGNGMSSLPPDGFTFRSGVTTVVDAGGSGWRTFQHFKQQVIDRSQTRVLALLNIVGYGMRGGPIEQDLTDMDAYLTAMKIVENKGLIVGIKTAHYSGPEWAPVDRAVEAGKLADVPVMVDFGYFLPERPFQELVLKHLRPGDIYTHMYLGRVPMIGADGRVEPYLFEARKRGVIFDVGHGAGSFVFRQAVPAVKQGFIPDSISTDLHTGSMNGGMKDQINVMSKFLNLGMTLEDVVLRATWNPAQEIKRPDLGHLTVGAAADIAVLSLRTGSFGFADVEGGKFVGNQKLECELTVREGAVVWDLNGISKLPWEKMPVRPNPVPQLQRSSQR